VLLISFVAERREIAVAKNSGKTTKSGVNTRKKLSILQRSLNDTTACKSLYWALSQPKDLVERTKLVELFEIEVDSRSTAPRPGSKQPRSKLVGQLAISILIEVSWSPPGPHSPANRWPGSRQPTGLPGDRWGTAGEERLPKRAQHPTKPLQTDRQTLPLINFPRFSSAYSLVCVGMAHGRSGIKNSVKTASSLLLLRHRRMPSSGFYLLWETALEMMGSMVGAPGPLGGVGAALCRRGGADE
jgi:hypothetical protein